MVLFTGEDVQLRQQLLDGRKKRSSICARLLEAALKGGVLQHLLGESSLREEGETTPPSSSVAEGPAT